MQIIYLHDTLCAWSMLANPTVARLAERLPEDCSLQAMHLALFTGQSVPPMNQAFFDQALHVGTVLAPERLALSFSAGYYQRLQTEGFLHNSWQSALAVAAAEQVAPALALAFSLRLQHSVFIEGLDPQADQSFIAAAEAVGIPTGAYREQLCERGEQNQQRAVATMEVAQRILQHSGKPGIPLLLAISDEQMLALNPYDSEQSVAYLEQMRAAQRPA